MRARAGGGGDEEKERDVDAPAIHPPVRLFDVKGVPASRLAWIASRKWRAAPPDETRQVEPWLAQPTCPPLNATPTRRTDRQTDRQSRKRAAAKLRIFDSHPHPHQASPPQCHPPRPVRWTHQTLPFPLNHYASSTYAPCSRVMASSSPLRHERLI